MGNINLLEIFTLILTISVSSGFNLRKIGNDTLEQQQKKGAEEYSRIYGGYPAEDGHFLYQVGLRTTYANEHFEIFGGSLITVNYVLTAAQCVENAQHIMVHLGSRKLYETHVIYNVGMHNVTIHSDYVRDRSRHNIAVIHIESVVLTDRIRTIPLPPNDGNFPSYVGAHTKLAGWGETLAYEPERYLLRFVSLEVIKGWQCARSRLNIDGNKLCTGAYGGGGCTGDSGSPLVLVVNYVTRYQIGISTTAECKKDKPNVFTRIDRYFQWIKDNTDLDI